jgi:hypothetical protein
VNSSTMTHSPVSVRGSAADDIMLLDHNHLTAEGVNAFIGETSSPYLKTVAPSATGDPKQSLRRGRVNSPTTT